MQAIAFRIPLAVVGALVLAAGCSTTATGSGSGASLPVSSVADSLASSGPVVDTASATSSSVGGGNTTTKPTKPTTPATSRSSTSNSGFPSPGDCVSYDPSTATVAYDSATSLYTVTAGSTVVARAYGNVGGEVGQEALALVQRYTKHCYIGRSNTRDEHASYVFDYWRNPSGQTPVIPGQDDACSPYNNKNLTVEDMGDGEGWRVKDHDDVLHVFDNQTDADNGKLVLLKYSQACQIGDSQGGDQPVLSYFL